jgi:hypothetical protein
LSLAIQSVALLPQVIRVSGDLGKSGWKKKVSLFFKKEKFLFKISFSALKFYGE